MRKIAIVFMVVALCCGVANAQPVSPISEFLSGDIVRFSTRGHIKANGAAFSMQIPKSWAILKGDRANILQAFGSENGKGLELALISALRIPSNISLKNKDIKFILSMEGQRNIMPEGAFFITAKSTLIDGEPAGLMEFTLQDESADPSVYKHVLMLTFIQEKAMVTIQFQVGGFPAQRASIEKRFSVFQPLFQLMMNSIIIDEKWKRN